jgi:hypothetical protein
MPHSEWQGDLATIEERREELAREVDRLNVRLTALAERHRRMGLEQEPDASLAPVLQRAHALPQVSAFCSEGHRLAQSA